MSKIDGKHYLNADQMIKALEAENKLGGSAFIWGNIGIGKSSVVRQFAEKMHKMDSKFDEKVVDIRLALKGPEDLQGLPTFTEKNGVKVTTWAIPEMFLFDKDWKGVILLDEFNLSQPAVMNACYQLIQDRKVSGIELPKGAMIIAAGNPSDCNINATELPQALKNRFNHYYMKEDLDVWIKWAIKNNINETIITFLKTQKPELFLDYTRLEREENEFATPRNWEAVSKVLNLEGTDMEVKKDVITGRVGMEVATLLFNYIENKMKFQDPDEILVKGKEFTDQTLNGFYGTFLAAMSRSAMVSDIKVRDQYVENLCKALLKLNKSEWVIFATKLLMENEATNAVLHGDLVIALSNK